MQKGVTHSKIVTLKRAGSDLKLATYSKALRSTVEERGLQAGLMGRSNFYNVIGCSKNNGDGSLRDVCPGYYRLNQYLSRIGLVDEAKCSCRDDEEIIRHLILSCPR
jgi:hypothetical protein